MKILHIITSLRAGGAERLVTDLLPRFKREGHDVSLLLFDGTRTPFFSELEAAGVPVRSLSSGSRAMRNPLLLFPLIRHLRKNRYDIVHTHNTSCQLLAALAGCFVKTVLVTTEHNTSNRRRAWKWYSPIDRFMYGRYSRIICVGFETECRLNDHFPSTGWRSLVIQNGIDLSRFGKEEPSPEMTAAGGKRILMVAAFRAQKDHATLIRAMASLPGEYTLFLAGGAETAGDRKTMTDCMALTESLGLQDRVHFLGVRSDVPGLMAAADALVLSSRYEGNPLSAIEAMASGRPVIVSDVPGLIDIAAGAALVFPQGNAPALAALIRKVCADGDLASKVAGACLLRSREYDIDRTARSYLQVYHQLNHISI